SLPAPVPLTQAGVPPCRSAHCRILSWSVVTAVDAIVSTSRTSGCPSVHCKLRASFFQGTTAHRTHGLTVSRNDRTYEETVHQLACRAARNAVTGRRNRQGNGRGSGRAARSLLKRTKSL